VDEILTLGRTLKRWRREILANHMTGASNGPTEAMNLLVKKVKRVSTASGTSGNYRLRVLLHCGGIKWNAHPASTMRGHSRKLVA
jgi:transposase